MTMLSSLVHSPIITCHRLLGSLAILVYMEGDEKRFALDTFKQLSCRARCLGTFTACAVKPWNKINIAVMVKHVMNLCMKNIILAFLKLIGTALPR